MIENYQLRRLELPFRTLVGWWQDDAIRISIIAFVILRVATGIAALIMVANTSLSRPAMLYFNPVTRTGNASGEVYYESMPPNSPLSTIVAPWRVYDTVWYMKIAIQGYRHDDGIVFPPLFPILIRAFVPFSGNNYVLASLLVSNICCLIAFILLFKLIQREFHDDALATRTIVILAAFPTAYYLMAGYTETLFLALTLGAFLAAFDKKWWLAGILAFFASLTRLQGAVLCLPLAWIAFVENREKGTEAIKARIPAVVGAGVGTVVYLGYIWLNNFGSLDAAFRDGWKLTTKMPWASVQTYLNHLFAGWSYDFENANAFVLLIMILLAVYVTFKMRPVYAIYTWSTLFVLMARYHYGFALQGAQFESIIRYVLMLFPCFIAGAMLLRNWRQLAPYLLVALPWQILLLSNFLHWHWVA